jgi:phosphoketolase
LFPPDDAAQAAYQYAIEHHNKGFVPFVSKSPVPTRLTATQAREAVHTGAAVLVDVKPKDDSPTVVFASAGDMILQPILEATETLRGRGLGVRVVAVVNPRRFYRPSEVAWASAHRPDGEFVDDSRFEQLFGGDLLIAGTGEASAVLEPVLARTLSPRRIVSWQRGETTATGSELMEINGMTAGALVQLVEEAQAP